MTLSIIIPCYNHGHFIQEAIDSVLALQGIEYEIIIVNDGSTDPFTDRKLKELQASGFNVLSHNNRGLGFTRNKGVQAASGKYILPLDADNKIKPEYIYKALPLLESNEYDIVYAKPQFFGSFSSGRHYITRPFNIMEMMVVNYIDACALYKKEVWEQVNGYDTGMPYPGQEDWEFWVHAFAKGFAFKFIDEELFYYRVENNSMITSTILSDKDSLNQQYILTKHPALFREMLLQLYYDKKSQEQDIRHPFRTFFKYAYHHFFRPAATAPLKK